eukprot:scaffold6018_cov51-Phaeocystis_antarctica.AAC.2
MARMVATLDVSRLSGWLNADESCQFEGGHTERGEVRACKETGGAWGDGGGRGLQGSRSGD